MTEYVVRGICEVNIAWLDIGEQSAEVYHTKHHTHGYAAIDAIHPGETQIKIPFEVIVDAIDKEDAVKKAMDDMTYEGYWNLKLSFGTVEKVGLERVIPRFIKNISCESTTVKKKR